LMNTDDTLGDLLWLESTGADLGREAN
jgi:hypothetical protein